jgi:hypothetical protein
MMDYLGAELERQGRRDQDQRRRWELEEVAAGDGLVVWVRPNWTEDWKA